MRIAGCQRMVPIALKTASLTLAVVVAEYCGYSGKTRIRAHPAAFKALNRAAIEGAP